MNARIVNPDQANQGCCASQIWRKHTIMCIGNFCYICFVGADLVRDGDIGYFVYFHSSIFVYSIVYRG